MTLQVFESSYLGCKSHSEDDDMQNYLVFQPVSRYFKMVAKTKVKVKLK